MLITVSTRRNQEPLHTWGWKQWVRSTRHPPHHPTLRASQHLDKGNEDMNGRHIDKRIPGSGIVKGSSSSQPSGFTASSSRISYGASSSQSSGFTASGSAMRLVSTQVSGFLSSGSSISAGGLTGGEKSSRRSPRFWLSPLIRTS